MGQRKKAHKFFRWMRQSDLPEPVPEVPLRSNNNNNNNTNSALASTPESLRPFALVSSSSPPHTFNSNLPAGCPEQSLRADCPVSAPSQPIARSTSIALQQQQQQQQHRRRTPPEAIILRVKELTAHQCFTQHSLRRIYVQPPAVTTTTAPAPAVITTTDETRAAPNETAHSAAPNVDRRRQQPYNQHQQQHNQQRETLLPLRCADSQPHHLTDRKYVAKPVVQRQPLQTLAESPAHAVATVTEKTVSCRLYDCILPATCTTRNASSEPPSVLKLDLHQQQQRLHSVTGTNSNTNSIGRSAQLSKKKFLLEVMDRSVDSIGSCSLDVDAESTDFSDTSGSLNLCTPSSGKDFTREFTSRIHERCQLGLVNSAAAQRTTTILDPTSGKIRTVLTAATVIEADADSDPSLDSPAKKPSYLNLACCVNGYSNLTTYDSKLRQNINRSREVSPIRPIIHTLQYSRHGADANGGQYLVVPVPMPIINDSNSSTNRVTTTTNPASFAAHTIKTTTSDMSRTNAPVGAAGAECTGLTPGRRLPAVAAVAEQQPESPKSFIQQRVERLYGPSALAAGFYSPKRSNGGAPTDGASILAERSLNAVNTGKAAGSNGHHHGGSATHISSSASKLFKTDYHLNGGRTSTENDGEQQSLPVLRHLRPEFRAQLPIVASPKRSPPAKQSGGSDATMTTTTVTNNGATTTVGDNHNRQPIYQHSSYKHSNGGLHTNTAQHPHSRSSNGGGGSGSGGDVTSHNSSTPAQPTHVDDARAVDVGVQSLERRAALDARASTTATSPPNGSATATAPHGANQTHTTNNGSNSKTAAAAASVDDYDDHNNGTNNANSGDDECDDVSVNTTVSVVRSMKITDSDSDAATAAAKLANGAVLNGRRTTAADEEAAAIAVPVPAEANVPTGAGGVCYSNGHHNGATAAVNNGGEATPAAAAESSVKDGLYFLAVMNVERERLIALAVTAEQYMDGLATDVDEEIVGHLRSAAGKARLLATQKIRQFEGLCHNNLNQVPGEKFPTTAEDLQGFWDMVMLQVYNVDDLFRDIERYRANNWEKLPVEAPSGPPTGSRLTKRPMGRGGVAAPPKSATTATNGEVAAKKSALAAAAAQRREAQRKQLMELKRRAKMQQQTPSPLNDDDAVLEQLTTADVATTNGSSNSSSSSTEPGIAATTAESRS